MGGVYMKSVQFIVIAVFRHHLSANNNYHKMDDTGILYSLQNQIK